MFKNIKHDTNTSAKAKYGKAASASNLVSTFKPYTKPALGLVILLSVGTTVLAQQDSGSTNAALETENSQDEVQSDVKGPVTSPSSMSELNTNIKVDSSTNGGENNGNSSVELKVNGQSIPIPENGTHEETITTNESESSVKVDVHNSTSTSEDGDESTRIRIRTDTDSDVNIRMRSP